MLLQRAEEVKRLNTQFVRLGAVDNATAPGGQLTHKKGMATKYTELIRVNFTPEQMDIIRKVAETEGQTIAGLVRYCTLKHLEQVLKPWNVKL